MSRIETAFLFDLDGTLVDSVYQHVLAWKHALDKEGINLSVWRIHRRIGMSGGLFTNMLLRETALEISPDRVERLRQLHSEAYLRYFDQVRPLPGAREVLDYLTKNGSPWAVATSGRMETAKLNLDALGIDPAVIPVVTRDQVKYAKPDPEPFPSGGRSSRRQDRALRRDRRFDRGYAGRTSGEGPWRWITVRWLRAGGT